MNFSLIVDVVPQLSHARLSASIPYKRVSVSSRSPSSVNIRWSRQITRTACPNLFAVREAFQHSDFQPLVALLHHLCRRKILETYKSCPFPLAKIIFLRTRFTNITLLNRIAYAYVNCLELYLSRQVLDNMSSSDAFSWTVMILAAVQSNLFMDGLEYFIQMITQRFFADKFVYSAVIQLCIGLDSVELEEMVLVQIVVTGFSSHSFVATSLLNIYAKLGKMEESSKIFESMTRGRLAFNNIAPLYSNILHCICI